MDGKSGDHGDLSRQLSALQSTVADLRERVNRLENRLIDEAGSSEPIKDRAPVSEVVEEEAEPTRRLSLEQQIGEYWFAQAGMVILLIGLIFLVNYAFTEFGPFWQAVIGYGVTLGVFIVSRLLRTRKEMLARILFPGSLLLAYFVTLRLHFFHANPIIGSKTVALLLLISILGIQVGVAWRRESQWLAFMPVILGFVTALISDTHHFALAFIVVTAVTAALIFSIKHWQILGISSMVLAYLSFLVYLLNNPLLGKTPQLLPQHDWIIVYLLATLVGYTLASFRPHVNKYLTRATRIALTTVNSSGFYLVSLLVTFHFFRPNLAFWNFVYAGVLFTIAVAHWTIRKSKYSTSFYASFSYIALTVALLAASEVPNIFLYLVWQSAIVIGTAIWFQSAIIIWANMGIFLLVLFGYFFIATGSGLVNFHFAIVSILSERLLATAQSRIKNLPKLFHYIYIGAGYFMLIFGLAVVLPASYVSVTWFGLSAVYLLAGYTIDLPHYRWMGFGSIVIPVFRIFVIDLAALEPIYRVLSFVVVGIGLIAIAIFYARKQ